MLRHLLTGLCDLVYPPRCLICKKNFLTPPPADMLCLSCRAACPRNMPPFCLKCSRHLDNGTRPKCPQCAKRNPRFDFAWAACLYDGSLREPIRQFKYNQKTCLRKPFARFMTAFVRAYHLDMRQFDIMVPIPLFPARLRERGYNQAQLLAEQIAREYRMDLSLKNLVRIRNTRHQTLLSEKERWTNIHEAFRIRRPADFSGKNILIVDDLLTTGATASEAARTLKGAGAETVGVLTLAITS